MNKNIYTGAAGQGCKAGSGTEADGGRSRAANRHSEADAGHNWVNDAKRGTTPQAAPGSRTVPEPEAENARLRKELAKARMERDIVKKAAAYFARESLPSTRS